MSSADPPQTRPHVLIIGAGITGIVLAHGLQQVGQYPYPKDVAMEKARADLCRRAFLSLFSNGSWPTSSQPEIGP